MVRQRFGARAERRAFHADISAAVVNRRLGLARGLQNNLPQFLANRIGERDVRHDAAPEKCVREGLLGAVNKLINQNNVARLVFFLQRADGADADDPRDAEFFHGPDVGAMIQLAGQNFVAASVSRQENHVASGDFSGEQIVGRPAEGRFDFHPFLVGEAFDVVKSRAADDSDCDVLTWGIFNRETRERHENKRWRGFETFSRLAFAKKFVIFAAWNYFNVF